MVDIATFQLRGSRGKDLPAAERVAWGEQVAALVLTDELSQGTAFWLKVSELRGSAWEMRYIRSLNVASSYGRGRTRRVVAVLLTLAADETDDTAARNALMLAGARAVFTAPDPPGRVRRYAVERGFEVRIRGGARALAHRGAGLCLSCDAAASPGTTYCRRHDRSTTASQKSTVARDLRRAIECAAPAILGTPAALDMGVNDGRHGGLDPRDLT